MPPLEREAYQIVRFYGSMICAERRAAGRRKELPVRYSLRGGPFGGPFDASRSGVAIGQRSSPYSRIL